MEEEKIRLTRYKAIPGYGERVWVNNKDKEIYTFFDLISIWTDDSRWEDDDSISTLFELPVGFSFDSCDRAMRLALDRLNIIFVDE